MSRHIIEPLLNGGTKALKENGPSVKSLARASANAEVTKVKANQSTFVPEVEEVRIPANNLARNASVSKFVNGIRTRGSIDVSMPPLELTARLTEDLQNAGLTGPITLAYPVRQKGKLGEAPQTLYRNYQQEWQKTGRPQEESLYAELDGERFFGDVKNKKTGRLAIRRVSDKLNESIKGSGSRGLAIAEQSLDKDAMKKWNSYLKPPKDGETYEAHHLNMIKLISRIVNGLNTNQRERVYSILGNRYGLFTGNDPRNKVNLTFGIHKKVHREMEKIGLQYQNVIFDEKTPLKKRIEFIRLYIKQMDHIQNFMYKHMSRRKSVVSKLRPENRQFRAN